jgi:carbon-monoxide dehydrogenase medium subunit
MKAPSFDYARPRTLPEALALLREHGEGAKILAGGQSLMPTLNMRLSAPQILIDINAIDGLSGIRLDGDVLHVGAMTRHADVERSALVSQHAPLIGKAIPYVAHPAIRNRGTFGGSIAFADPAAELPACVVALGARLILASAAGRRTIDASDFFLGMYRTALAPDEILVACEIPVTTHGSRHGFAELSRRHGDYAVIGIAANVITDDGAYAAANLVYFAAGARPVVAHHASAALVGRPETSQTAEAAVECLAQDLDPPTDLNADSPMRLHLARVLTRRVLQEPH